MSSSQATGEMRPDDRRLCDFPCRKAGSGPSSAILRFVGALRDRAASSNANSGYLRPEIRIRTNFNVFASHINSVKRPIVTESCFGYTFRRRATALDASVCIDKGDIDHGAVQNNAIR